MAQCNALEKLGWRAAVIPAADIADVTSSALAAITSEVVCGEYCNAIARMCEASEENRVTCGVAVITAVLAMMEAHPDSHRNSEDVQYHACEALAMLACNEECAAHMRAGGRAEALLRRAMAAFPDDNDMRDDVSSALSQMGLPVGESESQSEA